MGKLLSFVKRNNSREYDFDKIATILTRKKIEHRSDVRMLRDLTRDLRNIHHRPELVKQIWEGIGYRYVKRGKVFAYSERDLENNQQVEEVLVGSLKPNPAREVLYHKAKYLFRAEAEYMEIRKLVSDLCSIEPDLLTDCLTLNFSNEVIAGYFNMESALLIDLEVTKTDRYTLVTDFVNNKYRLDKPKEKGIYYVIATCLEYLHTGENNPALVDYSVIVKNLQDYFRVCRYIDENVKEKYLIQPNQLIGHIASDKGEVLPKAINATLLLHDLYLALDMEDYAKAYEIQRPVYLCCFGNHEIEESKTAY